MLGTRYVSSESRTSDPEPQMSTGSAALIQSRICRIVGNIGILDRDAG
jgi:hypothetical protein